MNVSAIVQQVSVDLNDHDQGYEYTRWPAELLRTYLREALLYAGELMPELFNTQVTVRVKPGTGWQKACDCLTITRVLGESDQYGNITRYLTSASDEENAVWPGAAQRCNRYGEYTMRRYMVNINDAAQFRIIPPVPQGERRWVVLECYKHPAADWDMEIVPEMEPVVKQWMLYRAMTLDSENNSTLHQVGMAHYEVFNTMLKAIIEARRREITDGNSVRAVQNPSAR